MKVFRWIGILCGIYCAIVAHSMSGTWWATGFWVMVTLFNVRGLIDDYMGFYES